MSKIHIQTVLLTFMLVFVKAIAADGPAEPFAADPASRVRVLEELASEGVRALPQIGARLYDENILVRQTAAEKLAEIGEPAVAALREALANKAAVVRRIALVRLNELGQLTLDDLAFAIKDANDVLRWEATRILLDRELTERVRDLLAVVQTDRSSTLRNMAKRSLWDAQFVVKHETLRQQFPNRAVEVAATIPLPKEGWKFQRDVDGSGHEKKWYKADFVDSEWDDIAIEKAWQAFGFEYLGVAWYRRSIEFPAKDDCDGLELRFQGVDETAWVWVNGQYVGKHDIGLSGWNIPFALDVPSGTVRWGSTNQITVRVHNAAYAGGIWQPAYIDLLKVR